MNILSGLEKFGLQTDQNLDLYGQEEKKDPEKMTESSAEKLPTEDEFLLEKGVRCKVCDKVFKTVTLKSGRIKRLESDMDLRPRHQYIDTLKYDIISCPSCGYTAMTRYFDTLTPGQEKMIRENIGKSFKPVQREQKLDMTYEEAVDRYKLSLYNSVVKKAKASEIAYTCLKLSWVRRAQAEELKANGLADSEQYKLVKEDEEQCYQNAYDGFLKAMESEMYPMCGMEQTTVDYLIACMATHFKKFDVASRMVSGILTSTTANQRVKGKARELKEEIISQLKK